jgi:Arc/MetJ-type ribon-helix-helix transcriptional regulator
MRKPKPVEERVQNAGVSLPPRFLEEVRDMAKVEGYETLTALVRYLLTQWMQEVQKKWDLEEIQREAARLKAPEEPPKKRGRPPKNP